MHCRDISGDEFETIAAELTDKRREIGEFETVTGNHKDHGLTILIRDATRCMVVVDNADALDASRAGGLSSEGWLR